MSIISLKTKYTDNKKSEQLDEIYFLFAKWYDLNTILQHCINDKTTDQHAIKSLAESNENDYKHIIAELNKLLKKDVIVRLDKNFDSPQDKHFYELIWDRCLIVKMDCFD